MQALIEAGRTLTFERTIEAPQAEVFRALITPGSLRAWLCDTVHIDARKGGLIYLAWNDGYYSSGEFTDIVHGESLSFTWRGPGDAEPSLVHVTLDSDGSDAAGRGTNVSVTHSGIGVERDTEPAGTPSSANGVGTTTFSDIRQGWSGALENLQSLLETGDDLRFTRRPMFGLNGGGNLNDDLIARLGVPVKEGIWIGSLIEGMGPQAAGLQKDDVVVRIGDQSVVNFPSFGAALQRHKAGDEVPVTFYRGPLEHTVTVKLSARPRPEYPKDKASLASAARDAYAALDAELDSILDGVADEAAERRTSNDQWSAKEVIAHLLAAERDIQTWITSMIEDAEIEQPFHSNTVERLRPMTQVYSPLPALVQELKRTEAITAEMVATLPDMVVERKNQYNQIATWMVTFADHHREHFGEIKELVGK